MMPNPDRFKLEDLKAEGPFGNRDMLRSKRVRIWQGDHGGAWWRPPANGYTVKISEAAIYDFDEAWARSSHCGPEKQIVFEVVKPGDTNSMSDREIDFIHETVDTLMYLGGEGLATLDMLCRVAVTSRHFDGILSLLVATLPVKSKLAHRPELYQAYERMIDERQLPNREGLLVGLK